ncbi:MAG: hypothetical protein WA880_04320 [Ornithinimicrobium sp.]
MDRALHRILTEAFKELPAGAADLTQEWVDPADMWFVEVVPHNTSAAGLSVAFDGYDLLNFAVGNISFEMFPVKAVEDLDVAGDIAQAVFNGRVEECGFTGDAFGRIVLNEGLMDVGRALCPGHGNSGPSNVAISRTPRHQNRQSEQPQELGKRITLTIALLARRTAMKCSSRRVSRSDLATSRRRNDLR